MKRKHLASFLSVAPGPLPTTLDPLQDSVSDNAHAPRLPVVLNALPNSIVVDSTMNHLIRWNKPFRDGLALHEQEQAVEIDRLPITLAAKVSAPVRQPWTTADKQAIHTVWQQVHVLQQVTMREKDVQVKLGIIGVMSLNFVCGL